MYKRKLNQTTIFESPEMFGGLELNPENEWVKLSKIIPWWVFEEEYAKQFPSGKGQPAESFRAALGSQLIKEKYQFSDEMTVAEIAMNPYLQYFIGLTEYQSVAPFHPSMMTRFRLRLTTEIMCDINDIIIGRRTAEEIIEARKSRDDTNAEDQENGGSTDGSGEADSNAGTDSVDAEEQPNEGTLILDATCAPQAIRFPTDTSLLNEARLNAEGVIDSLHEKGLTDPDKAKPRTYREEAKKNYNRFSKNRKKNKKNIRKCKRQQLNYLKRDLGIIDKIIAAHPDTWKDALTPWQIERLAVIRVLYRQQREMYEQKTNRVDDRIVSLSQSWVRPIVRGKQNAPVEFGAKVEMSDIDGYLRIELLSWNAFNESRTLQDSVEAYRKAYGHYPERVLADTIFRTSENIRYCKSHGIHLNGPKLGRPSKDPKVRKEELRLEWQESGERGDIERRFGIGKRCYSLGNVTAKLKHTSEIMIHMSVLMINLQKRLRLLLRCFFVFLRKSAFD